MSSINKGSIDRDVAKLVEELGRLYVIAMPCDQNTIVELLRGLHRTREQARCLDENLSIRDATSIDPVAGDEAVALLHRIADHLKTIAA